MEELSGAHKIELAKYLMNTLNEGDWQELVTLANVENLYNWEALYRDVYWHNSSLKKNCIDAVNTLLEKNPTNIQHIWDLDTVQSSLKLNNIKLYNLIESIISKKGLKTVTSPTLVHASKNVFEALLEAELLIKQVGATSAYDRTHTALHGFLQTICDKYLINYTSQASITALLPKIHDLIKSKVKDDGRNEKVFAMLLQQMQF